MGCKPHGITVMLYSKVQSGVDGFGRPIYTETAEAVDDVIVAQPSAQEVVDTLNLTGKHLVYTLGIPKGDAHEWTDRKICFFGETFRAIAAPVQGIDDLVPLSWNKKIQVERYG